MKCADFRRLALSHGGAGVPNAKLHIESCAECRRFAAELRSDNEMLRDALAIEVPDGLAERILLSRGTRRSRRPAWALASATVFATVTALLLWQLQTSRRVASDMIAHVIAEPRALAAMDNLPADRLSAALALGGVDLIGPVGALRYAGECPMPGGVGHHFVIDGPYGKTTIIVGPQGPTPMFAMSAARDGYYAEIVSIRGAAVGVVTTELSAMRAVTAMLESS
jgi:hypothetical protein